MRTNLIIYRIVTYLLLFIAAFMSMGLLTSILSALTNPVTLLPLFLLACIVIYTYCSWRFLVRGIDKQLPCKNSLRDLIRVNGFITIALTGVGLIQMVMVLYRPVLTQAFLEQVKAAQPAGSEMSDEALHRWITFTLWFLVAYCSFLLGHALFTFRLIRRHRSLFDG